ncbi:CASP-like protein-like [Dorcoceras hygrometricum]|uniref:CASP-like protein n=1 Tax=Dorcoceras hygrometricum TaxID=472368 RepID=A0A2Z6ZXK9_9LAMI|nr:CASP-like protein-like [Dorcoceras hygrometricum]KZV16886.1 CASP-like protein-like [Dorcoceras hygrometricum]
METQSKQRAPADSSSGPGSGSPPLSPLHELTLPKYPSPISHRKSGEHISLSPPRSSISSDRTTVDQGSSPERDKPYSPEIRPPVAAVSRPATEQPVGVATKTGREEGEGGGARKVRPSLSILRSADRRKLVKRAALGSRIFGFLFCLVSLSVMAADRKQGWALDSFDRYKEFRYCISVNIIGFVYSGAQAMDLSLDLITGKYAVQRRKQLRYYFDFAFDQVIAYLLISASSSATVRIDDWQLNWGKDKFPDMATASVSMSFLAFLALAFSSLISGYTLYTSTSM